MTWIEAPLGDLLSYIGKGIAPKYTDDLSADNSVMVLGQKCVRNQSVNYAEARFHDEAIKPFKDEKIVCLWDILVNATGVGSAGRVAQVVDAPSRKCITDSHVITLRSSNRIDPVYLGYFVKSKQALIEQMAEGSTGQTEMNRTRLQNEILITFPESNEDQKAIANFGLAIDRKLKVNTTLNGYLFDLATARFEAALEECASIARFGDIAELEDSKRIPLNSRDREERKGPYPYYGATSIMDYVDDYLFDGIRVLLGEDGSVVDPEGKPILQYVWGKYWVNNHAHIVKASGEYSLEAIYVALRRTSISHIVTGAVQMKISQRNLQKLELSMPNPGSLDYLQPLFAAYRNLCEENNKLVALRDVLLPKLMSGEIDVSEVDLTQLNSHLSVRPPLT